MRIYGTAILGVIGGLVLGGAASAGTFSGNGVPSDAILNATVVDFESVSEDSFPTSYPATTDAGEANYVDPRVGARTSESINGLTITGSDTFNGGAASAIYFTSEVTLVRQTDADQTVFDLEEYVGTETFNTEGVFLTNWEKRVRSGATGEFLDFQPTFTTEFRFEFDEAVDAFGFNFGANDNNWVLAAYDENDVLLEELDIAYVAINEVSDGQYYGITAENIKYLTLTDTFVTSAEAGTSCPLPDFPNVIPGQICGEWVMIDNVTYANGTPVPVPAALPLLAVGAGILGFAARRRNAV